MSVIYAFAVHAHVVHAYASHIHAVHENEKKNKQAVVVPSPLRLHSPLPVIERSQRSSEGGEVPITGLLSVDIFI
jgi:hypothetical protein